MLVKCKVPKHLLDLTMATDHCESEAGLEKSSHGPGLLQDTALHALEERILRCLGAAVILQWNELPTMVKYSLFDGAASMSDPEQRFRLKQEIARFLHEHKNDARQMRH